MEAATARERWRLLLPHWNERFTVKADCEVNAHRPVRETLSLESILSHVEQRQVTNDYTVAWEGQRWQIPKAAVKAGLRRSTIRVEERLDGSLQARVGDKFVMLTVCEKAERREAGEVKRPARRYVPQPGKSQWMKHFSVANPKNQPAAQGI